MSVIEGRATVGPESAPFRLGAGDYAVYSAEVPHHYASTTGARLTLIMTIPPTT